ncbi:MAG: glycosyltransferase family 4 protein [Chloroflexota bacterium]|nr:glycosyltransferase family 4 protein [Chloroflexota bacterium]
MKILFVHKHLATFVKIDLDILRSEHKVRELYVRRHNPLHLIADMARAAKGVLWADLVFAWFGGYHALFPFIVGRLLGRKCVVIASGYDVAAVPEIGYGNMRSGVRRTIGLWVFRLAHKVLAVSRFTAQKAICNAKVSPAKLQVIYHGLEAPVTCRMYDLPIQRRGALTVSTVKQAALSCKGLVTFVKAASYLQDVPFTLVGPWIDDAINSLRTVASSNVEFVGPCYGDSLWERMLSTRVYIQVSASESFGMAVAEAMLCGCVPVVTDRGALPEVVGDNGFCVPYGDVQATVEAIRQALAAGPEAREHCRQHIIDTFPLERRKEQLLRAVRELDSH